MVTKQKERHKIIVSPHMLLMREKMVLLGLRKNTGYCDGFWHVPSGHMEEGEDILEALYREIKEELGISINKDGLKIAHCVYAKIKEGDRLHMFFVADGFEGEIKNMEPEKCERLDWFPIYNLPDKTVEYTKQAVRLYVKGENFSIYS